MDEQSIINYNFDTFASCITAHDKRIEALESQVSEWKAQMEAGEKDNPRREMTAQEKADHDKWWNENMITLPDARKRIEYLERFKAETIKVVEALRDKVERRSALNDRHLKALQSGLSKWATEEDGE